MNLWRNLIVAACLCWPLAAAAAQNGADHEAVMQACGFEADLYAHIAASRPARGNLFFSPYSIRVALGMTATGARGPTETQMRAVLHLPLGAGMRDSLALAARRSQGTGGDQLLLANALWVQSGYAVRPQFEQRLQQDFAARIAPVDFVRNPAAASDQINDWVSSQTHHLIPTLFDPGSITPLTRLILTNAVYFKGTWDEPFAVEATQPRPFHLDSQHDVQVPLMASGIRTLNYLEDADFQAVALPYHDPNLQMIILVPKAIDGLAAVEKHLDQNHLERWLGSFAPRLVVLRMPKFTMSDEFALSGVLKAMGMTDAFSSGADFSGIAQAQQSRRQPPLVLTDVIHKTFIAVDEKGTVAAAATGVEMGSMAAIARPMERYIEVTADRPFLFFIRSRAVHTALFMGRICDPR